MAEAHTKNHDYHLVDPSPWPAVGSVVGLRHGGRRRHAGCTTCSPPRRWCSASACSASSTPSSPGGATSSTKPQHGGYHTRVVQISHRYGMILFIASEVMFFVAWFWAYFDAALFPGDAARRRHARPSPAASGRRQGHRDLRSLASAAAQHADPADLGHDGHLGASRAAARRPPGREVGPVAHRSSSARSSPACRPTSTRTPPSPSPATSTAPPSSWRPASTASTCSSARSS